MTEKTDEESVLGSLPATRPTRFGRERRASGGGTATKPRPAKAKAAPRSKAAGSARSTAAKAEPAPRAAAEPATPHRPRPVRAGAPSLAGSTKRTRPTEPPESTTSPPSGAELVTTAIQAAGELAQIGLTVGGQVLKRAVNRLPQP